MTSFEGSIYERYAIEVYEAGLGGVAVYASIEEALDDWRKDYEADRAELDDIERETGILTLFTEVRIILEGA